MCVRLSFSTKPSNGSQKVSKNEYKQEMKTFIQIISQLPTRGNMRYDIIGSKEKRTIQLNLNHLSNNKQDVVIKECDVDEFRFRLRQLWIESQ